MTSPFLLGVNLAGAEFGNGDVQHGHENPNTVPGVFGKDYTYPTHDEIDYYGSKGLDVIRLPFLWERLQRTELGPLDPEELGRLDDIVNYATSKGLKVEIEPHNYGYGFNALVGSGTPNSAFADLWSKLASHYKSNPDVVFGLMNEPHVQSANEWFDSVNAAIAAIRSAGATQRILVPGTDFDGAWTWKKSGNQDSSSKVVDPANNFTFEVHQYLDEDGSGTHKGVVSATIGVERVTEITQWAEATGNHLFLGEVGVFTDQTSLTALDKMLTYIQQHTDVWEGATYWAGGPWWPSDYIFLIEPQPLNGVEKPQMTVLLQHLKPTTTDVQSDYAAITRLALPLDQATTVANAIDAGTQTEVQYVSGLLSQASNTTIPAVAVEGSMYGSLGTAGEVTALATQFLPDQAAFAVQHGLNAQVYASEAVGLAFAFSNETGGTAFADAYGPSNLTMANSKAGDVAFATAAATAIFGSASTANLVDVIDTWVTNWKAFYTSHGVHGIPNPTADQVDLAARGTAWGDAVGVALANDLGPLEALVNNFLMDAAEGIANYTMSLVGQPPHYAFQGEISAEGPGATFKFGNADNLTVTVNTNNDTYIIGDGKHDTVNAGGTINDIITIGNGAGDVVNASGSKQNTITLGDGDNGTVFAGTFSTIKVGNGKNDTVFSGGNNTITVGDGNDTIHVGFVDIVTGGKGHDKFVFDQTTPHSIGAVTINNFDPTNDVITIQAALFGGHSTDLAITQQFDNGKVTGLIVEILDTDVHDQHPTTDIITLVGVTGGVNFPGNIHIV